MCSVLLHTHTHTRTHSLTVKVKIWRCKNEDVTQQSTPNARLTQTHSRETGADEYKQHIFAASPNLLNLLIRLVHRVHCVRTRSSAK